ncbi:hypothetical protein SCP_0503620 [Sparassis crispa]|uniref:MYND-type domain-containing protein n=1 Tax=Sparassis crispa TaxID=139825 RepID=A0A401GNJ4_9APHY|nr:hypothetical protein SCP_0503620 [Sparassis crispa]GBE83314.1 hypothetical protein SCP_0503620 [Sparassis crispa]
MGVDLPPATKLPDDALEKRLKQALNASQCFSSVIPDPPLKPTTIPAWPPFNPKGGNDYSLQAAFTKGNFDEAFANETARIFGRQNAVDLYVNPMIDLRQTLMTIGKLCDEGFKCCVVQDTDSRSCAINIRFLSVHQLGSKTPIIVLLYQPFTRNNVAQGLQWVQAQRKKPGFKGLMNIKATELEQKILLRLLTMNAKHLSPGFKPSREAMEQSFKLSFVLPVGPLAFEDLGKLNADTGCVVCGDKTTSRCTQCLSVAYCGRECQLAHWPEHKQTCRSLKGGTWRTIRFANCVPGCEGMYAYTFNRFNFRDDGKLGNVRKIDAETPPPNIHDTKTFLVKLQVGPQGHYMIYDRQRSFEVYFINSSDPGTFSEFRNEMLGPRGTPRAVKMYRWAKRVSEWELSVCIDRLPQTDIRW